MNFWLSMANRVATAGPVGHLPKAPGTWGTLAGLPVYGLIRILPPVWAVAALSALIGLAVLTSHLAEKSFGEKDPGKIVIDEIAGMAVTLAGIPLSWGNFLLGFGVFRALDIVKPFPIRQMERLTGGGLGIVLDDVAAGVIGNGVLRLLIWGVG